MDRIARVVNEVSGVVSAIASAIEDQSSVTHSIAQNLVEASGCVEGANKKASQTSLVSGEIAGDVQGVNRISGDMMRGSELVLAGSHQISEVARQLSAGFSRFEAFYKGQEGLLD
jgi:methyl-accepting chemotaxis protein